MRMIGMLTILFFCASHFLYAENRPAGATAASAKTSSSTVTEKEPDEDLKDFSRDPFESNLKGPPPVEVSERPITGDEPVLQGFAIGGKKATVTINGKTYVRGAPARDGIEVVEVRRGEADIKWNGEPRTLRLVKAATKVKRKR